MAFSIRISAPAQADIDDAFAYIANDSFDAASSWLLGLEEAVLSLSTTPTRFALIPESSDLGVAYRSMIYHSHRVIYRIDEKADMIHVIRVYHGSRRPLKDEDLVQ